MTQNGNNGFLFYQEQDFDNYHGMIGNAYNDGHQQYMLHRASDPYDLLQYHRNANAAAELPMQNLTKPANDTAWTPQLRSQPQQLHCTQPMWNEGSIAQMKAMTEPTPNQDIYPSTSPQKSSDVSDSAYESMPTSGGAIDASYNTDGNEVMGEYFATDFKLSLTEPKTEANPSRSVKSEGHFLVPPTNNSRRKQHVGPCRFPGCNKQPKNQSDAKKHALTHSKPHRCQEPECNRKDGFATVNDLERHKKSVHSLHPRVGNPAGYICAACQVGEGGQRKFWPRRDNFKAHLKRKHGSWNEEHLLEASKQNVRPEDAQTADGLSICDPAFRSARQSQVDSVEGHIYQHMSPLMAHPIPEQHDDTMFAPDSAMGSQTDLVAFVGDHTNDAQGLFGDQSYELPSPMQLNASTFPFPSSDLRISAPAQRDFAHAQQQHGMIPSIQVTTSSLSEPQSASTASTSQSTSSASNTQGTFPCPYPDCNKIKTRECDLRKHLKRHTRPYGCTFHSCTKKFGSRNDWKRHESSQHQLTEMWKCAYCTHRPFSQLPQLISHLRSSAHHLVSQPQIDAACADSRLGREGHHHFWCGFCRRLVKQGTGSGNGNAWDARFKHIGDHFDKDLWDSWDWVCVEENRTKREVMGRGNGGRGLKREWGKVEEGEGEEGGLPEAMIEGFSGGRVMESSWGKKRKVESFGVVEEEEEDEDAQGESDQEMY